MASTSGLDAQGDVPPASPDNSFERLMLPHLDAAYNLARWLMRDAEAGQDVLQDAMLRALTYFPSFKGINPRAWLLQIVRNTAYGSMALNRGRETVPVASGKDEDVEVAELVSGDDDPETALIRAREGSRVRALVAALPVELREALVLREFEQFSYKEIAEATQTPIGTVMSRLWRARQMLAQAVTEGGAPR
ncbi:MAG: sigma-70 family RNA polymerase sigma factor [Alphaproteobacteria bacterium]|nr:sigma-70 family RNA polymerase sigma factor [Alphaproteobacteria bacterium]